MRCSWILMCVLSYCSCGISSITISMKDPFEHQIKHSNTLYVLTSDYDLKESRICIPPGCTFVFDGGSISNGVLVGDKTIVINKRQGVIFNNVILEGSFGAKRISINCYKTDNLDYLYSFIQAFSGTQLYLTSDYSATKYLGQIERTMPLSIDIDGKGFKLTLFSFWAYNITHCSIKNIIIDSRNNTFRGR